MFCRRPLWWWLPLGYNLQMLGGGPYRMLAAHQQSIRLLQGVLIAAATLPAMLFAYASWQGYRTTKNVADRQIAQSRDVLTEHALKVFEAVDRSIAETNEIIRDMSDAEIAEHVDQLHYRLKKLADG